MTTTAAGSIAFTITLASLASSSTLLVGRESTAVSNLVTKYDDVMISGWLTTGTSPTAAKTIELWAIGALDDTPTYPNVFDGTDSAETITSDDLKNLSLRLIASIPTSGTSDQRYPVAPQSLKELFGVMPTHFSVFATQDTGVAFNATAANQAINYNGIAYS